MLTNKPHSAPRFSRRYARYFAVQAMYHWLLNPNDSTTIESYIRFNPVGLPHHFNVDKKPPESITPNPILTTENLDITGEEIVDINELKQLKSIFHEHKRDEEFLQSDYPDGFIMIDILFFNTLFNGMKEHHSKDCETLQTVLDRPFQQLSIVERAVLLLGTFELAHMDTPYKVVINEAIDLCKIFGSGQRYINGVLDHLAAKLLKKQL